MTTYKYRKRFEIKYWSAPWIFFFGNYSLVFFGFPILYIIFDLSIMFPRITTFQQQHRPAQKTSSQLSPHQAPSNTGLKAARLPEWYLNLFVGKEYTSKHHAEKDKSVKLIICYQWEPSLKVGMRINLSTTGFPNMQ